MQDDWWKNESTTRMVLPDNNGYYMGKMDDMHWWASQNCMGRFLCNSSASFFLNPKRTFWEVTCYFENKDDICLFLLRWGQ